MNNGIAEFFWKLKIGLDSIAFIWQTLLSKAIYSKCIQSELEMLENVFNIWQKMSSEI